MFYTEYIVQIKHLRSMGIPPAKAGGGVQYNLLCKATGGIQIWDVLVHSQMV